MAQIILAQIKQYLGRSLLANMKMAKVHLALTLESSWKFIASSRLTPSLVSIGGRPLPPRDAEEADSTKSPIKWLVEWTPSSHADSPPQFRTYLEANSSCLGVCGAIQALCLELECEIDMRIIGIGTVKDMQIVIGR